MRSKFEIFEILEGAGLMVGEIDADLLHRSGRERIGFAAFQARRGEINFAPEIVTRNRFGHGRTHGVKSTRKQYGLRARRGHRLSPSNARP